MCSKYIVSVVHYGIMPSVQCWHFCLATPWLELVQLNLQKDWFSSSLILPILSRRQHLTNDVCLEDKREDYQHSPVLYYVRQSCTMTCTHTWAVSSDLHSAKGCVYIATICSAMSTSLRLEAHINEPTNLHTIAFSALTLLIWHQQDHRTGKNWMIRYLCGYLSSARCKWFAYCPVDSTATPSSLCFFKIQKGFTLFWCQLTQDVLAKKPLHELLLFVTSCMCTVHFIRRYLSYIGGNFEVFPSAWATHCITGGKHLAWRS